MKESKESNKTTKTGDGGDAVLQTPKPQVEETVHKNTPDKPAPSFNFANQSLTPDQLKRFDLATKLGTTPTGSGTSSRREILLPTIQLKPKSNSPSL